MVARGAGGDFDDHLLLLMPVALAEWRYSTRSLGPPRGGEVRKVAEISPVEAQPENEEVVGACCRTCLHAAIRAPRERLRLAATPFSSSGDPAIRCRFGPFVPQLLHRCSGWWCQARA